AHNAFTSPTVVGVVTNGAGTTVRHCGFAGGAHPTPKKHTRPLFRSRCLTLVHSAASLPSNLRSKSGRAHVTSPPDPMTGVDPSLNISNSVGSVPSPMQQFAQIVAVCWFVPGSTPNVPASAAAAANDRLISHNPGGFKGFCPPIENPVITGCPAVPSRSIRQKSNMKIPLPSGRGRHPTSTPVFGSFVNLRSVGPSSRLNGLELFPLGFPEKVWFAFSSTPVPSSNRVTENVFDAPVSNL